MKKIFQRLFFGDVTDSLTLNIMIYAYTYVLSIVLSLFFSEGGESFLLSLVDIIVPTTITLILSSFFQNVATIQKNQISLFGLLFFTLFLLIIYFALCIYFRINYLDKDGVISSVCTGGILFGSSIIVVCNMYTINKIEQNIKLKQCIEKSISG